MWSKLTFLTAVVLMLGLVNSASAGIELKVDLVNGQEDEPWPKTFKGGDWTPWAFWADDGEGHDGVFITGFAGLDVNIGKVRVVGVSLTISTSSLWAGLLLPANTASRRTITTRRTCMRICLISMSGLTVMPTE
ncbi:MAG: hypothetical protein ACYSR6_11000 [Planctomycetota bacterium]